MTLAEFRPMPVFLSFKIALCVHLPPDSANKLLLDFFSHHLSAQIPNM